MPSIYPTLPLRYMQTLQRDQQIKDKTHILSDRRPIFWQKLSPSRFAGNVGTVDICGIVVTVVTVLYSQSGL